MIERLDMFGKGMDEAKRQAVHSVNILKGKSEQQNVGSISSKMDVIKKPFIKEKEILGNILQLTDNALNRCETLSQEAKGWYAGEFVQDEKTYHTSASLEKKTDDAIKRGLHKKDSFIIIYLKESIFKEDWKASEHKSCERCRRELENKCFDRSGTV